MVVTDGVAPLVAVPLGHLVGHKRKQSTLEVRETLARDLPIVHCWLTKFQVVIQITESTQNERSLSADHILRPSRV